MRVWGCMAFNDVSIRDPHLGPSRLDERAEAGDVIEVEISGAGILRNRVAHV